MAFSFEELKVWHITADLSNEIDLLVFPWPGKENTLQMRITTNRNTLQNNNKAS
jgi:hypothetical protein